MDAYTHATWNVRSGHEEDFERAWHALASVFNDLPQPPLWGTLLRRVGDSSHYVSFGAWPDPAAIEAMRSDPDAQAAMTEVRRHCMASDPASFELVAHVASPPPAPAPTVR